MSTTQILAATGGLCPATPSAKASFQARVVGHLNAVIAGDPTTLDERRDRHGEEAIELQQALGATREDLHALVDYVFDRPAGDPAQELGGVMTTLAGLATYAGLDMMVCGEAELARTWQPEVFAKIQRKRANRHGRGALPGVDGDLVTAATRKTEKEPTWDEGVDFALTQLCAMLSVDPSKVSWDAATETAEGDVRSVIGNILRAWASDDWQDLPAIRAMLLEGQGDDDGSQILPDFQEDMTAHSMVAACVHLLERRRDALDGHAKAMLAPASAHPELDTLRDLAHVLDAQIEEGAILPDGMGLVIAALARVKPENVHTGERCQVAECLVHGPCEECPTEAQWTTLGGLLTTWLAEHPREVVIHKTQGVGTSDLSEAARIARCDYSASTYASAKAVQATAEDWNPAGTYPLDGTEFVNEGSAVRRKAVGAYPLGRRTISFFWMAEVSLPGGERAWINTGAPIGRWRKAPPVRV